MLTPCQEFNICPYSSGPYVKHDHGPYVVLHGPVWTLLQNVDLQSQVQILDPHEGPKCGPIYRDQNLDLSIGTKLWSYVGTKMWTYLGSMGNIDKKTGSLSLKTARRMEMSKSTG